MIIIDEATDTRLIKALESVKHEQDGHATRCVHVKLSHSEQNSINEEKRNQVVLATDRHVHDAHPEIYFCEDGDIYILTRAVPSKQVRSVMMDIANDLQIPISDEMMAYYELDHHVNQLLINLERKVESKAAREAQLRKQQEQEKAALRKASILNAGQALSAAEIQQRRMKHKVAELMIIEDDPFSRRLVENVLKNEYPLTALADATRVFATYAATAPDLLFLDINLPDVSGLELLEKLIALDPHAIIIMLSGNSDQASIMQAMKAGAKGFIAKPFTREKIFQYIHKFTPDPKGLHHDDHANR